MTKQERDNIVGVSSIQTTIRTVEVFIKDDGLEAPSIDGLVTQPLYDVLNMMCGITFGTPVVSKDLSYGQQESLLGLQHWYNRVRSFVNQGSRYYLHPMEITGVWDMESYRGFQSIVECYRKHTLEKQGVVYSDIRHINYRISNLDTLIFSSDQQLDYFHKYAELATGVQNIEQYIGYMRTTGWKFSVGCTDEGHPVGVIAYSLPNPMMGNKETVIAGIYVSADHRGRGIGKALVQDVITTSASFDYEVVANKHVGHVPGWSDVISFLSHYNVKM